MILVFDYFNIFYSINHGMPIVYYRLHTKVNTAIAGIITCRKTQTPFYIGTYLISSTVNIFNLE